MSAQKRDTQQISNLQPPFKVGDSVVVKPGVKDPDYGDDMGGWQGRITKITADKDGQTLVLIAWDSLTLGQIPTLSIKECAKKGSDWGSMRLFAHEVELSKPRDTPDKVKKVYEQIEAQYRWFHMGDEGERIHNVLKGIPGDDDLAAMKAWVQYLSKAFTLPFQAVIAEWQGDGPLQTGDRVTVLGIQEIDEDYGILVGIKTRHGDYAFPLCDLEARNHKSSNFEPLQDYAVWFANR